MDFCKLIETAVKLLWITSLITPTISAEAGSGFCILHGDNRYTTQDIRLSHAKSLGELARSVNEIGNLTFHQQNIVLNTAYALKYGYHIHLTDYQHDIDTSAYADRHPSWYKLFYPLHVMEKDPWCQWLAFLDSDAFFWMDGHTLSLEDYFATTVVDVLSSNYKEFEKQLQLRNGSFPLADQSVFFMIGLNGDPEGGDRWHAGFWNADESSGAFVCAGLWFVKNSHQGSHLLHHWSSGTNVERSEFLRYRSDFPWEQAILHKSTLQKFRHGINIYPYKYFGAQDGTKIIHHWGSMSPDSKIHDSELQWRLRTVLPGLKLSNSSQPVKI